MEKFTCVLDACSYINLQVPVLNIRNQDLSVFQILCQEMDIKLSEVVNKEIKRNKHKFVNLDALQIDNKKYKFRRNPNLIHYDKVLFGGSIFNEVNNQGEKINFAVTMDLFLHGNRKLIYLSDDKSAEDNFFVNLKRDFKFCQFWDSYDAIFFLYVNGHEKSFTYLHAKQSIEDIISSFLRIDKKGFDSQLAKGEINQRKFDELMYKKTDNYSKTKVNLIKRLDFITNILNYK